MPASRFYSTGFTDSEPLLYCNAVNRAGWRCRLMALSTLLLAGNSWSAQTSYEAGAALNYKFDDNANIAVNNPIALGGWILDGFFIGSYATSRFNASVDINLGFERYNHASQQSDSPDSDEPDPSDYNRDNQKLDAGIGYDWERHTLALSGGYYRNSTRNTGFLDTGEVDGSGSRIQYSIVPSWQWLITERQTLATSLSGKTTYYEGGGGIDYDSASLNVNWSYILTERISLQLQPNYSWFKNQADISVESNTFSLQGGFVWSLAEKWQWNLLVGSTKVYTVYGEDGIIVVDPETGEEEVVEVEDQDSSSFSGNTTLSFAEERYGFNAGISAGVVPTGNGVLQQQNRGQLVFYWKPLEQMQLDLNGLVGRNTASDERIDDGRVYQEVGARLGYQFLQDWWLSARYRFRQQREDTAEDDNTSTAHSNQVYLTVSYRLPQEVF